jgi:hypothetical protein|tara:strand:+ start:2222 stop:2821 length:600 start_codon:yes stop_codon:yes gene_type:complete
MQVQTFTKAYLVEFTDKISGYRFLKFGATNNYDVYQRFQHEPEQYKDYDIEVIGSIYAKQKNINYKRMGEVEDYFLSRYHRNTKYFKDNFSGISETYQPGNDSERNRIIKEFYDIKTMILRGEDIKDVIKENEEGDGTVRDFDRRASESFQSRSIILRKKKYEGHKTTEPIISCDCMFGCNICNPPLTNCTAPDPTDWY